MNARSNSELKTTSLNTAETSGSSALKKAGTGSMKNSRSESGEIRPAHKSRPALYLDLFLTFAGIGVSTFGGGYAMLPILQREVCDKRGWATEEELMDYYAIGQCTPGVIAVNTATFVGYRLTGPLGGVFATLGVIFPSIVIICIISAFLKNFAHSAWAIHAFSGIRAAVCVLILDAVVRMGKKSLVDHFCIVIFLAILAASLFLHLSPILYVVLAGALGVLISRVTKRNA
jgi:chromate transporter